MQSCSTKTINSANNQLNPELAEAIGTTKENWFKELNEIFSKDVFEENNDSAVAENCELVCEEDFLLPPSPKLVRGKKLLLRRRKNLLKSANHDMDDSLSQMLLVETKPINNFIYPIEPYQNLNNNKVNISKNINQQNNVNNLKDEIPVPKACDNIIKRKCAILSKTSSEKLIAKRANEQNKANVNIIKQEYNPWKIEKIEVTPTALNESVISPCSSKKELIFSPIQHSNCGKMPRHSRFNMQYTSSPKLNNKYIKPLRSPRSDESLGHVEEFEISTQFCKEFEESFEEVECAKTNTSAHIFDDIDRSETFGAVRSEIISRKKRHLKQREKQVSESKNESLLSNNTLDEVFAKKNEQTSICAKSDKSSDHCEIELFKSPCKIVKADICSTNNSSESKFIGFQTASFKTIQISEDAIAKAQNVFDDLENNKLNKNSKPKESVVKSSFYGFRTANEKELKVSEKSMNRANKLFANLDEDKSTTSNTATESCGVNGGCSTGESSKITIENENKMPEKISDASLNLPTTYCGFKTASFKKIAVSEKAKQKASSLFANLDNESLLQDMENKKTKVKEYPEEFGKVNQSSTSLNSTETTINPIPNFVQNSKEETRSENELNKPLPLNHTPLNNKRTPSIDSNNCDLSNIKTTPKPSLSASYKTPNSKHIPLKSPLVRSGKRRNSLYKPPRSIKKKCE